MRESSHFIETGTAAGEIRIAKRRLREQTLQRIHALDRKYKEDADRAITGHLLSLPEYLSAHAVFCFVGSDHEIDTRPFLAQVLRDGKALCVPLCTAPGEMQARQISSLGQLRPGRYGLPEPDPETAPLIRPEQIGLAVIPCLTCSHSGLRLGHGGGYYDTFFSRHTGIRTVLICRERVITEAIPHEPHDLMFTPVVTEAGTFPLPRTGR
jgi:5-formyltetrahydrofolate cyclo-ligase